jgi:hypothetical protein
MDRLLSYTCECSDGSRLPQPSGEVSGRWTRRELQVLIPGDCKRKRPPAARWAAGAKRPPLLGSPRASTARRLAGRCRRHRALEIEVHLLQGLKRVTEVFAGSDQIPGVIAITKARKDDLLLQSGNQIIDRSSERGRCAGSASEDGAHGRLIPFDRRGFR